MAASNERIAEVFAEIADLQEILGENPFRVRAYRNAARIVGDLGKELSEMVAAGADLTQIDGIGKDLAAKIATILSTGTVDTLEKLRSKLPAGIGDLLRIPNLGPKRVKALLDELKIGNREQLAVACREGRVRELKGFGEKTESALLLAVELLASEDKRYLRTSAATHVDALLERLRKVPGVTRAEVAGSFRRGRETVGDLDLLCAAEAAGPVMQEFLASDGVAETIAQGDTKSSVRLRNGIQVDLRVVPEASFGAALNYFTGSKAHNIVLRRRAQERGLKLNEYGLMEGETAVAGRTEEEIYKRLDLPWIPPELREDRGEVDAADRGRLPRLVELDDIRGDLHAHTTWTDGTQSIEELARTARERGYEYIAVTDHSKRLAMVHGLDEKRLLEQIEEIEKVRVKGIRILKGIEVDILDDGALDLSDDVLQRLDLVVGSVHGKFNLTSDQQTERVLRAMDNRYFTIFAHPTGRLLLDRPGYAIDIPRVIRHAKQRGCFVELNANPYRLDLDDRHVRVAKEEGVLVSINTDAHSAKDFDNMRYGLTQARRGWLEARDVLNTRPLKELTALIRGTMG